MLENSEVTRDGNTEVVMTMLGEIYTIDADTIYSDNAGRMFFLDEHEMQTHIAILDMDALDRAEA